MEQKIKINCVIGIDPGSNGGIAIYIAGHNVKVAKMPKDMADFRDFVAYYAENYKPVIFLEKLSVRPDDIKVVDERAAMGKLYRIQKMMANYEQMKAIVGLFNIPFVLVHPMTWQTKLALRIRGASEDKAVRKNRYKNAAAQYYPNVNVSLWNADALLIMHFGRWALVNDPKWVRAQLPEREYQKLF